MYTDMDGSVLHEEPAEKVEHELSPEAAIRLVNRTRRKVFFVTVAAGMPSTDGMHYPYTTALRISQRQMTTVLLDAGRFAELKARKNEVAPRVTLVEYDNAIFLRSY